MLNRRIDERREELQARRDKLPSLENELKILEDKHQKLQGQLLKRTRQEKKKNTAAKAQDLQNGGGSGGGSVGGGGEKRTRGKAESEQHGSCDPFTKKRKLDSLQGEIDRLRGEIDTIRNDGEIKDFWLNSAEFILKFEEEKASEERAMREMENSKTLQVGLGKFLKRLPVSTVSMDPTGNNNTNHTNNADGGPITVVKKTPVTSNLFNVLEEGIDVEQVQYYPMTRQKEVYAEYLAKVEGDDTKLKQVIAGKLMEYQGLCEDPNCRGSVYIDHQHDHMAVCERCGSAEMTIPEIDVGTFNEPLVPMPQPFAYKKINHFRDWLAKSQGKENTTIPQQVYDTLLHELKKARITMSKQVTRDMIRKLLKKLKMARYFRNVSQIHYHITGLRPPRFTEKEEAILMKMFEQLEPVYERVKEPGRVNFFSFEFVLHKFCEIQYHLTDEEDWDRRKKYFKTLKGNKKRYETDQRWKACCQILNWKYFVTD